MGSAGRDTAQHGRMRPLVVAALMAVLTLIIVLVGGAYLLPRAFAPLAELQPTVAGLAAQHPEGNFRVSLKAVGQEKILVVHAMESVQAQAPADNQREQWARKVAWTAYTSYEDAGSLAGIAVGFDSHAAAYRFSISDLEAAAPGEPSIPETALELAPESELERTHE